VYHGNRVKIEKGAARAAVGIVSGELGHEIETVETIPAGKGY
jgi:hypothetical protein